MAKIGDVCASKIDTLNAAYNGKIDYIDISAVDNREKKITQTAIVLAKDAPSRAKQLVEHGDVIVSLVRPNLNAVAIIEEQSQNLQVASTGYCVLRCNQMIYNRYLFYFCQSETFVNSMTAQATGASYPAVSNSIVKNCEIPLPERNKQKEIADILDKVTGLISLRKQQLAKLDELVKARFVEMFGDLVAPQCEYPELKLVDICADADDIKCGPFGTQLNRDEYKAKGVAVWEIPQINSGFSEMPTHFITEEKAVILNAYSIEPGDIAMSRKGNVGKCGLFPENLKKGIIHSDVLRIRVDKRKVDSCFMMYQLHFSEAVKRQIEMVSSGAIMAGINVTKLKQIKVRIPELENQRMFAAFVERVDQQKQTIQQSLEKLELLKKALMQEYFG